MGEQAIYSREERGMNEYTGSKALYERACAVLAGGVSSEFRKQGSPHPLFYAHARGSRVTDVDGNEYLDFTLSQGPLLLGHGHPELLAAVAAASEEGQSFAGQHLRELELAERIQRLVPCAELLRFGLDGWTSVHTALRPLRSAVSMRVLLVKREDRPAHPPEGERAQIGRTWARCVERIAGLRDRVVGLAVRERGLDVDREKLLRVEALAAPLAQIPGGGLLARQEDRRIGAADHGARAHVNLAPADRLVAVRVLQDVSPVAARQKLDVQVQRFGPSHAAAPADRQRA